MNENVQATGILALFGAIVLAVIGGFLWFVDPLAATRIYNFIITAGMDLIWMGVIVVVGIIVVAAMGSRNGLVMFVATALLLGTLGFGGYYWWSANWRAHNAYVDQAVVTAEAPLEGEFNVRTPFSMADTMMDSNMDGLNGDKRNTKFLPQNGSYSALVERKTRWAGFYDPGYEAVIIQNYDDRGVRNGSDRCEFSSNATRALGAPLWNSLERAVSRQGRTLTVEKDDAWAYCDGDTAKIVMPLVKWTGFWTPKMVPAGVAIYDGATGEVTHRTDVKAGELPGPSVGASYSDRVNTALEVYEVEGINDYKGERGGLADEVKDDSDVNADNPTNFSLYHQEDGNTFVTPFTNRANAKNTTHLGVMTTDGTGEGSGKTTVYKLDPAVESNAVLSDKIRSKFSSLPWQSGLRIQEFTPKSDDVWVATLGQKSIFSYRVTITATGEQTGTYTLELEEIENDTELSDADTPADPEADQPSEGGETVTVDVDLKNMSDEQIAQLVNDAVQELASR